MVQKFPPKNYSFFSIIVHRFIKKTYFFVKSIDFYVEWVYTLHNS